MRNETVAARPVFPSLIDVGEAERVGGVSSDQLGDRSEIGWRSHDDARYPPKA
jgi:hypothetical protein